MATIDPVNTGSYEDDPSADYAIDAFTKINANINALNTEVRGIAEGGTGVDTLPELKELIGSYYKTQAEDIAGDKFMLLASIPRADAAYAEVVFDVCGIGDCGQNELGAVRVKVNTRGLLSDLTNYSACVTVTKLSTAWNGLNIHSVPNVSDNAIEIYLRSVPYTPKFITNIVQCIVHPTFVANLKGAIFNTGVTGTWIPSIGENNYLHPLKGLDVSSGGTGATNAADARANLGIKGLGGIVPTASSLNAANVDTAMTQLDAWYETWSAIHFKNEDYNGLNKPNWSQLLIGRNGHKGLISRSAYNGAVEQVEYYGTHNTVPVANGGTGGTTAAQARTNLGLSVNTELTDLTASRNVGALGLYNYADTGRGEQWATLLNTVSANYPCTGSAVIEGNWLNFLSIRHRGGRADGNQYGFLLYDNAMTAGNGAGDFQIRRHVAGTWYTPITIRTTGNTWVDGNGFVKAASPIIELYSDKINLNDEAALQPIEFEKLGIGDYLIKGSSGFALEGWYVEQPKDSNGNIFHAIEYEQLVNGDLAIKTYECAIDNTGKIIADHSKPIDIKQNRFVTLRLNSLPADSIAPSNPTIVDDEGNPAPTKYHTLENGVWVISVEDAEKLEADKLESMPKLTRYQFFRVLLERNYDTDSIEAQINAIEDDYTRKLVKLGWQTATVFIRTDQSVLLMQSLLNLTTEQVNEMWNEALTY